MASVEIWVDKDTFVRSDAVDYDFSSEPFAWTHTGDWNARTFLEFDIQDGPVTATAVYLQLFMRGGDSHLGAQIIDFERLTEPIPDPTTWNTQPSATTGGKYSEAIPAYEDYEGFSFDITELYNDAKAAGSDTLGIRLKYQTESLADDYGRLIRTREFDETLAASILVNYEEPTCYIRGYAEAYIDEVLTPVGGATIDFGFNGETRVTGADGYTEYVACDCTEENLLDLTITPPSGYACRSPSTCTRTYFCVEGNNTEEFLLWEPVTPLPPTISSLSWSPAGDFHKLPSGASLTGSTEDLYLIGTDPDAFTNPGFSDGEALLRIGTGGAMFAVAEGDHFRFDGMEWWVLNIVCSPECDFITLADENAEAAREPKIGDEIQFSCNVDWHGEDPDEVRWYYAKTPNRCFDENDVSWTPFANEQYPLHVFEEDDDTDIVFIKAWARNKAGEIGELGDTCEPVFNLWAPRVGFQEGWLIAAFMVFILPGLAEKTEYYGDLVFDGTPTTPSGGFSLLWSPAEFVHWIAEAAAGVAEDMLDIIFGTAAAEETSGYSILWTAAEFVAWLYKSIAAAVESILDLVFGED